MHAQADADADAHIILYTRVPRTLDNDDEDWLKSIIAKGIKVIRKNKEHTHTHTHGVSKKEHVPLDIYHAHGPALSLSSVCVRESVGGHRAASAGERVSVVVKIGVRRCASTSNALMHNAVEVLASFCE